MIVYTIGVSGSGKSRLAKQWENYLPLTSPVELNADDIRKEVLQNVSDQSRNNDVFNILKSRKEQALFTHQDIINSNTNCNLTFLMDDIKHTRTIDPNAEITLVFLEDSLNPEICYDRIRCDLDHGVDRSDVPKEVVLRQSKGYSDIKCHYENAGEPVTLMYA